LQETSSLLQQLPGPYLYGGVSFSDEANMLAAVTNESALRLFDLETSAVLGDVIVSHHDGFIPAPTEVVFDPGGEWLAAIVDGRGVVLLDASLEAWRRVASPIDL